MKEKELKVLSAFYPEISRELNPNEVKRVTNLSYGGTYETLLELAKNKILIRKKVGNVNLYKINYSNEIARDYLVALSSMQRENFYKKNKAVGKTLKSLVERVLEKLDGVLYSVILFGSYAKGEAREKSDIDLMFIVVEAKDVSKLISDICSTKSFEIGRRINSLTIGIKEFENMFKRPERNVSHEIFSSNIILYGSENYYNMILRCLKWKEFHI